MTPATMRPSVLLYKEAPDGYTLYLGEVSTAQGLALIEPSRRATVVRFGATNYEGYSWGTEEQLPALHSVGEVRSFLETDEVLGLVDFEAEIEGIGRLSSHDDAECNFNFTDRAALMAVMQKTVPASYSGMVINTLLSNPGIYITCSESGHISKYASFDEYLAKQVRGST